MWRLSNSSRFTSFYYCRLPQAVVLYMPWNKVLSSFGKPTAAAYLSGYPILRYAGRGPVTSKIHPAIRNGNIQWWCFTVPVLLASSIMRKITLAIKAMLVETIVQQDFGARCNRFFVVSSAWHLSKYHGGQVSCPCESICLHFSTACFYWS